MKKVLFSLVAMLLLSVSGIAQTTLTFTKVNSASELEVGTSYLIVGYDDNLGYCAMSYQKSNNRHAIQVTEAGGSISLTPASNPDSQTEAFQFILMGSNGAWEFYDPLREGYLYAASSSANQLKTQSTNNANGQWAIMFNPDGTAEVTAQGENTRNIMRFNENSSNGSPLFSCYNSGSSINVPVSLYKVGGSSQPKPEPTNYPTNFRVSEVDGTNVTLTWTDAVGGQVPDKYLVVASTGAIPVPTDGVPVLNDLTNQNVAYGVQTWTFTGLEGGTTYHFAIFPYTNSSIYTDYKTDGNYPTDDATTEDIEILLFEDFNDGLGVFTAYDAYGDQNWHQGTYQGTTYANMNGYAEGAPHQNEDWLISPTINIPSGLYEELQFDFRTAKKFEGPDLQVLVSMDYDGEGEPSEYTWLNITDVFDFSTGDYEWVESGTFVIDEILPGHYHFAFLYTSTNEAAASWEIDYVKLIGKGTTSVNENNIQSVSLYPNPAREQVSFTLESDAQVSVFDVMGRKVSEMTVVAGEAQLNVSELESGVYFVNVRYANGSTAVSKFVKY
ncbi:MAG: choice-of-anchor J domain-containing protein [Bacteroidales bacterium]|nr:choice-of-anchor J domain-containing protein [Bacteroidales bacterium]